jgi:hypothetical protein
LRVAEGPPAAATSCEIVYACASNAAGEARTSPAAALTGTPATARMRISIGGPGYRASSAAETPPASPP